MEDKGYKLTDEQKAILERMYNELIAERRKRMIIPTFITYCIVCLFSFITSSYETHNWDHTPIDIMRVTVVGIIVAVVIAAILTAVQHAIRKYKNI